MGTYNVVFPDPEKDAKLAHAMNHLMNSAPGAQMFWEAYSSGITFNIVYIQDGANGDINAFRSWDEELELENVIFWDPDRAYATRQADGTIGALSPATVLFHEIYHGLLGQSGKYEDFLIVQKENELAEALGGPARPSYNSIIGRLTVSNPTASSKGTFWKATDGQGYVIFGPAFNANASTVEIPNSSGGSEGGYDNLWWEPITYAPGYTEWTPAPLNPGGYWNPYINTELTAPSENPYELRAGDSHSGISDIVEIDIIGAPTLL